MVLTLPTEKRTKDNFFSFVLFFPPFGLYLYRFLLVWLAPLSFSLPLTVSCTHESLLFREQRYKITRYNTEVC
jgi:hypothetical protein